MAEQAEGYLSVAVPETIQGVLVARIDRLPEAPKRLLQTASVLGREVPRKLLRAIWEEPGMLDSSLRDLKRLEFLYERTGADEPVYVFKHILTQEVAYASLRLARRQALHVAAGEALETLYADRLEEAYDRLAYHYAQAREAAKAVEYLTRFAEKAARGYAHAEAAAALREALEQVERLPAAEQDRRGLDLVIRQAESLFFLARRRDAVDLLLQHQARLERLQDPSLAGQYHFWRALNHSFLGEREQAAQSAQRLLDEARRCGDEATMGKAYYVLALEGYFAGLLLEAVAHSRQAVALLQRTAERRWLGWAYHVFGLISVWSGDFELAVEAAARLDAIGEALGDRRLQTWAATTTGLSYVTQGDWQTGIEAYRWALERAPDPFETALVLGWLGAAYLEQGDLSEAIPRLKEAVQQANQYRSAQVQGWFNTLLSEAYRLGGQLEPAHDLARQGLDISRGTKFPYGIGLAERALGRIAQARGALADAASHLTAALETFTAIQARFEGGRTHLDLAAVAVAANRPVLTLAELSRITSSVVSLHFVSWSGNGMTEVSRCTNSSATSVAEVVRSCFQRWSGSDGLRNPLWRCA